MGSSLKRKGRSALIDRLTIMKAPPLTLFCLLVTSSLAQQHPPQHSTSTPPPPNVIARPTSPSGKEEFKIPNFTSCSIPELRKAIPALAHLKPFQDQAHLIGLLDKIGATTIDIARRTPDLISNEQIVSEHGDTLVQENYSFLVLQHISKPNLIVLDEFRVDAKTGQKFETQENIGQANGLGSDSSALELPTSPSILRSGGAPATQGFFSQWLSFYPPNRSQSEFRYLGEQKMNGRRTLVVAFAQKPGSVVFPATIAYHEQLYQFFMQGVAWVDAINFRILRLWTDVLAPPAGVPLRKLSTDVHFAEARVAEIPSTLWLPKEVVVNWNIAGFNVRNTHTYSKYRLFRAKSKLVLNP